MENVYSHMTVHAIWASNKPYRIYYDHNRTYHEYHGRWICRCNNSLTDLSVAKHRSRCRHKTTNDADFFQHIIYILGPDTKPVNCPLDKRTIETVIAECKENKEPNSKIMLVARKQIPRYKLALNYNSD